MLPHVSSLTWQRLIAAAEIDLVMLDVDDLLGIRALVWCEGRDRFRADFGGSRAGVFHENGARRATTADLSDDPADVLSQVIYLGRQLVAQGLPCTHDGWAS